MNFFANLLILIISAALGYFLYPHIFNSDGSSDANIEQVQVYGPDGKMTLEIDMDDIGELPAEVRIIRPVKVMQNEGSMAIQLEKGAKAKVTGYEAGLLSITDMTGKFSAQVSYKDTDFTKEVGKMKLNEILGVKTETDFGSVAKEEPAMVEEEPEVEEVAPEPVAETGPLTTELSEADLIATIQASIKAKAVSEFGFDGVTNWEVGEKETISDTEYQIGFATYEKETIFGNQPVIAKALVRNGEVSSWVYAKSGLPIP